MSERQRLSHEECIAWAERYASTPWNMLALATAADRQPSALTVLKSALLNASEMAEALAWIQEFASKMSDRHTGFVHVERRARFVRVPGGQR